MHKTWKPSDLFVKLSERAAHALAVHLCPYVLPHADGAASLVAAWDALSDEQRERVVPELVRIDALSTRKARPIVIDHMREFARVGTLSLFSSRLIAAVSTPDLALRLYLDDPLALERAYFQLATGLLEQVAVYQGQYVADVIPSYDRRLRMLKALWSHVPAQDSKDALEVADFVNDDRFVLALHQGAHVPSARRFDAARALDPNLCQPEIKVAILFRFDSSMLIVRAACAERRESLRAAFVRIFVGDARYFEPRGELRARYRLTIDPKLVSITPRPSLAKVASGAREAPKNRFASLASLKLPMLPR